MFRYLSVGLLVFALLSVPSFVSAIDDAVRSEARSATGTRAVNATDTAKVRGEVMSDIESRKREVETERTEKRLETETRRAEQDENILKRKASNSLRVVLALITRLEKIADRVESRIEKEGGAEARPEAQGYLDAARENLSQAKTVATAIPNIELSGERLPDNLSRIRTEFKEVRTHLRSAHENLARAVSALGLGRGESEQN
jgi:hypothetical protein